MTFHSTSAAVASVCLAVAFAVPANAASMTADEITASHAGKCILYSGPTEGRQCFGADGKASYDDKTYGTDTGSWKIEADKVCVSWDAEPGFNCAAWTRDGDVFSDGAYRWTLE